VLDLSVGDDTETGGLADSSHQRVKLIKPEFDRLQPVTGTCPASGATPQPLTGEDRVDVHANNETAWRWACGNGHMDVVKLLLDLTGDRRIDVHTDYEHA